MKIFHMLLSVQTVLLNLGLRLHPVVHHSVSCIMLWQCYL